MTFIASSHESGNLRRYLREIRKYPMLSAEEEGALARAWRDTEDVAAAHKLVTSHLRFVAKFATGYRGCGLPMGELISEGNIGMIQAVKRFDPDRGFRLATYAVWWIRAAIQDHILRSWSLVRMGTTGAQKKVFFNLRKLKGQLKVIEDGDLSPEHVGKIATELGVREADVVGMNRRLIARDNSLNIPAGDGASEWQDCLADGGESQESALAECEERNYRKALLSRALETLEERERSILVARRLRDNPARLAELSQRHGISYERVRQIESRAFEKLQKAIMTEIAERARSRSELKPPPGVISAGSVGSQLLMT